ncbi:succinate receptor 1-like [Leucoraja erinacea]|uniref:succinate receptor 1-like n=1 Tax=Leucoraja erinaceus TaxID=7782 RepID=UPI0024589FDA|nr:succinate receptor 1-like [Leucoraja erinacea]
MNNSCLDINPPLDKFYLTSLYGIQFVLGLVGNVFVIWAYLFCLKEWKCCNIYLFNLSISDLLFTCTLPLLVRYYSNDNQWPYSIQVCRIYKYILHSNMYASILFLTCISWDRYLLITSPLKVYCIQTKFNAIIICLCIWAFVTVEIIPMVAFFYSDGAPNNTTPICPDYASSGDAKWNLIYSLYLTVFGFILPLCVIIIMYVRIARVLKKMGRESSGISVNKPLRMVILAITIFVLFFTPYHVMRNVRIVTRLGGVSLHMSTCGESVVRAVYTITRPVAFLNSITNPLLYFMTGDKFREQVVDKLQSIFSRIRKASNKNENSSDNIVNANKSNV